MFHRYKGFHFRSDWKKQTVFTVLWVLREIRVISLINLGKLYTRQEGSSLLLYHVWVFQEKKNPPRRFLQINWAFYTTFHRPRVVPSLAVIFVKKEAATEVINVILTAKICCCNIGKLVFMIWKDKKWNRLDASF